VKIGAVKSDGRDLFTNKMMINGRVWRERATLAVFALAMNCLRQRATKWWRLDPRINDNLFSCILLN